MWGSTSNVLIRHGIDIDHKSVIFLLDLLYFMVMIMMMLKEIPVLVEPLEFIVTTCTIRSFRIAQLL